MRVLRMLRKPVPLAIWLGQLSSVTGDKLYAMALLWLVLQLTGSAKLMAAVSVAESVPYVLAGFLGAGLIARSRKLRAMIKLDLLSAAVIALIPLTYLLGVRSIALLVLAAAAASALEALFDPALQSVLPEIVPRDDLQPMVALTDTTDRLARVLGPGSAGLILLVIPEIHLFSFDAASFLASAAALAFAARRVAATPATTPSAQPASKLLDGLREVRRQPSLRVGLAVRASCNLVWPAFTIGLPFELAHRLHTGLASYGLLLGIFGAANLAGNLLSGSPRAGKHLLIVYCLSWSLVGAGFVALAIAPTLALAALATAWMGIFTPLANVSMDTHIATVVPRHGLARVYSLQRSTVAAASALGVVAVAAAIDAISAAPVIAAAGGWMILTGTVAAARTCFRKPAAPANLTAARAGRALRAAQHPAPNRRVPAYACHVTTLAAVFPPREPEQIGPAARAAERAGLAQLWIWEDCFKESGIATATAMLATTSRMTVAIGLLPVPLRNVALTAMEISTLARLFPGRLTVGVGHGVQDWMGQVGARAGSPMTLLREYTTALSALLRGERVTTDGQYVRLDDVALDFPPLIIPPLLVGGIRPRTVSLAGELADGLILPGGVSPDDVRAAASRFRGSRPDRAAASHGPGDVVVFVAAPAESPARDIAATVNEYGSAGATHVAVLPAQDDADVVRFADVLGREVSPLVAP
jgi:alkanesulfonate monooxygenase SsuD/methylene tetrahydromethanopterin reductase-like flavin-dependent oxidoreductase (luciferase family)